MTKKDLIESIRQNIPEGLSQIELVRYIYIELGKQRRFDPKYYYGNNRTKKKIYALAQDSKRNPKKFHNKKTLICVSISYLYKDILEEFGISSKVVIDDNLLDGHVMPVIELNDETKEKIRIKADLQRDLEYIQTGMKTKYFGTLEEGEIGFDEIDEQELKKIDMKIGYIKDDYKDEDIQKIFTEIKEKNASDSLWIILQDPRIYLNTNFNGIVEKRKYYRFLLDNLLKQYMNKKIFMFTCYREKVDENDEKQRDYTLCAYSYEKNQCMPYLYSNKEERFIPVNIEKLAKLEQEGLVLGTMPNTKGVKLLKRQMIVSTTIKENKNQTQR